MNAKSLPALQYEFKNKLNDFRRRLKGATSKDICELFDIATPNSLFTEIDTSMSEEEDSETAHEKYKSRMRALAQALSEHPEANLFRRSIEVLRRVSEDRHDALQDDDL